MAKKIKDIIHRLANFSEGENAYAEQKRILEMPDKDIDAYLAKLEITIQELLSESFMGKFGDTQIRKAIFKVNSTVAKISRVSEDIYPWFWMIQKRKLEEMSKTLDEEVAYFYEAKPRLAMEEQRIIDTIKAIRENYKDTVNMRENLDRVKQELSGSHSGVFLLHDVTQMAVKARYLEATTQHKLVETEAKLDEHLKKIENWAIDLFATRPGHLDRLKNEIARLRHSWIVYVRFALHHPHESIHEALRAGSHPTFGLLEYLARDE